MAEDSVLPVAPPVDKFRYLKAFSRSIFHIIHIFEGLIFILLVLPDDDLFRYPMLYYLAPIVFVILFTDPFNLVGYSAPVFITSRLGIFNTLRGRGFIYQAGGALAIAHCGCDASLVLSLVATAAWGIGIMLFSLGVLARDFGFENWVEPIQPDLEDFTDISTTEPPGHVVRRAAAVFRYITHIIHLSVALLFLSIVILTFYKSQARLFITIIYLIPLIIVILAIESCHLCLRIPPERLTNPLGVLNSLWGRGLIYQAAAALAITVDRSRDCSRRGVFPLLDIISDLILITWGIGYTMFVFGVLASVFKLDVWMEEPRTQSIRLEDSDTEEATVGIPPDHSE